MIMTMTEFRTAWTARGGTRSYDVFMGNVPMVKLNKVSWASSVVLSAEPGSLKTFAEKAAAARRLAWCHQNCTGRWVQFDKFTLLFELERDAVLCELFEGETP